MPRPEDITNDREFRIFAMKRSGHHAIISWLIGHFRGPVYFLNNCSFVRQTEFSSTRIGKYRDDSHFGGRVSVFCDRGKVDKVVEHVAKDELTDRPLERLLTMCRGESACLSATEMAPRRDCYMFNLEDFDLAGSHDIPYHLAQRGNSKQVRDVIVLRDPYNWLASRTKGNFPIDRDVIESWKSQAREALGRTAFLHNPLVINYNEWFSSEEYRAGLSRNLGLEHSDAAVNYIADFGGGSSFEGFRYQNRANEMNVLGRWQVFEDDARYLEWFADPELVELGKALFDMSPIGEGETPPAPARKR